jgi:hypothetical protein
MFTKEKHMAVNRKLVLAVLDKLEIEYTAKISAARAAKKLERAVEKDDSLLEDVEFTDDETALLVELGLSPALDDEDDASSASSESSASEESEDESSASEESEDEDGGSESSASEESEDEDSGSESSASESSSSESEDEPAPKKKGKKETKKKPAKKAAPKEKREGNIPLMKRLLSEGKSDKEIEKTFFARYKDKGKDEEWVRSRISIYRNLADPTPKKSKAKSKDKPAKASKTSSKKSSSSKSKKKGKSK